MPPPSEVVSGLAADVPRCASDDDMAASIRHAIWFGSKDNECRALPVIVCVRSLVFSGRTCVDPVPPKEIGRASCRERVYISVRDGSLRRKRTEKESSHG